MAMEDYSVNQPRVGTDSRLTQDLRYLLEDSRLGELHDQRHKQPLRHFTLFTLRHSSRVHKQKPSFGAKICSDICPWTLSVTRRLIIIQK